MESSSTETGASLKSDCSHKPNGNQTMPQSSRRERKGMPQYKDGWDPDKLEEELKQHPFFITELPKEGEPLPPLIEALQQLKYSSDENTPLDLTLNYKEDGLYHFKLKKYRIAASCFSEAIRNFERITEDETPNLLLLAQLYNNRAAAHYHVQNFRSSLHDCEKAMMLKPDYFKPIWKAIECCVKLEKWSKVLKLCDVAEKIQNDKEELENIRSTAFRNQQHEEMLKRKATFQKREKLKHIEKLKKLISQRNIKLINENFLSDEAAQHDASRKVVKSGEDGKLYWPVLFYYPQYSQSDLIEEFDEMSTFAEHLTEMLENERPAWDKNNEYHVQTVDLYFTDLKRGTFVKADPDQTLDELLRSERYYLPSNGVPSFFVMARDNPMCKNLLQRSLDF